MVEIRNLSLNQNNNYKNLVYGIGSESCCVKFINIFRNLLQMPSINPEIKLRIVTPKINQKYMLEIIALISKAINKFDVDSIVVNDYGFLREISSIGKNLILGRILSYANDYDFYFKDLIHPDELPQIIVNKSAPNILHADKVTLFKDYGIMAVELCPSDSVKNLYPLIRKNGFKIHIHYNSFVAGLSRVCSTAKINDAKIGSCSELCDEIIPLEVAQILDEKCFNKYTYISDRENNHTPNFVLLGNIVYRLEECKKFPYENFDEIIYDLHINKNISLYNIN